MRSASSLSSSTPMLLRCGSWASAWVVIGIMALRSGVVGAAAELPWDAAMKTQVQLPSIDLQSVAEGEVGVVESSYLGASWSYYAPPKFWPEGQERWTSGVPDRSLVKCAHRPSSRPQVLVFQTSRAGDRLREARYQLEPPSVGARLGAEGVVRINPKRAFQVGLAVSVLPEYGFTPLN